MKTTDGPKNRLHWAIRLTVAIVLAFLSACIIGPKQDDPESAAVDVSDTGTMAVEDTARSNPSDTSGPPADETGALIEAGADTSTSGDTAPKVDAGPCGDGGADSGDAADGGCSEVGGGDAVAGG